MNHQDFSKNCWDPDPTKIEIWIHEKGGMIGMDEYHLLI